MLFQTLSIVKCVILIRFMNELPINDIIFQLVKMMKQTDQPVLCTLCLQCLSTILKGDFLWIDTLLNSNVITIITSYDDVLLHRFYYS